MSYEALSDLINVKMLFIFFSSFRQNVHMYPKDTAYELRTVLCIKLQDIEVGKAVRPQLAMRVGDANIAWKKVSYNRNTNYSHVHGCINGDSVSYLSYFLPLHSQFHGKEVVVECKFDGDRIQIHKNGTEVHYFSR